MRFREILKELESCKPELYIQKASVVSNIYRIQNFNSLIRILIKLYNFDFLKKYIQLISKAEWFAQTFGEAINLSSSDYNNLDKVVKETLSAINMCIDLIKSNIKEQDPKTISFKLHEINNFEEFYTFNEDLSKIILKPLAYCKIDVEMGELEEGSRWQSIIVGSVIGLSLMTAIFRQSTDIIIHDFGRLRVTNEIVSRYEKTGKEIDTLNKVVKEMSDEFLNTRAKTVLNDVEKELEKLPQEEEQELKSILKDEQRKNELLATIRFSIEKSSEYIDKGLEIYQALNLPEEERYQLPNFRELLTMKETQLLIDKSEEN